MAKNRNMLCMTQRDSPIRFGRWRDSVSGETKITNGRPERIDLRGLVQLGSSPMLVANKISGLALRTRGINAERANASGVTGDC